MEDGLQKLAGEWRGELREKNLAGRVLADFKMIQALRLQKCPWHRIAGAMGVNPDSLRKLYLWTLKEIEAKRLEPPTATQVTAPARQSAATKAAGPAGGIDKVRAGVLEPPKATPATKPGGISTPAAKGTGPDSTDDPEDFMNRFSISRKETP